MLQNPATKIRKRLTSPPPTIILSNKEDDIFTDEEKTQKITIFYQTFVEIKVDGKQRCLSLVYEDPDGKPEKKELKFDRRFLQENNSIQILSPFERREAYELKFENGEIVEKLMKIIWKYKIDASSVHEITSVPPPPTITHSKHDIASVFSFELDKEYHVRFQEQYETIKLKKSGDESSKVKCSIHIDVGNHVLVVKPLDSESFEILFSLLSFGYDKFIFKQNNGPKIKLEFSNPDIAENVKIVIKKSLYLKETLDQETTALEWTLKKFSDDPNSIEEVKKIIQVYVKSFTIFKEENRQIIFDIYQKFNFHEMIWLLPTKNVKVEVKVKEEESEFSDLSKKRKASNDINAESSAKKSKNDEDSNDSDSDFKCYDSNNPTDSDSDDEDDRILFRYPNFEFRQDFNGTPKQKLIIFASTTTDKNLCHIFERKYEEYRCLKCGVEKAQYLINQYGERFVRVSGKHLCNPVPYDPEKIVNAKPPTLKSPRRQIPTKSYRRPPKTYEIFSPSKNFVYKFINDKSPTWKYCFDCYENEKQYVWAKYDEDKKQSQVLDEDHVCVPEEYGIPKKIIE